MDDEATPAASGTTYYALRPRTPSRAWLLAGLFVVAGVAAVVAGVGEPPSSVALVLGVLVGLAGIGLAVAAAAFVQSRTQHVVLSDEGFEVTGPGYHRSGVWLDVDAVSATPDGSRLVIAQGHVDRTFIQSPGGRADATMQALVADITARLNGVAQP